MKYLSLWGSLLGSLTLVPAPVLAQQVFDNSSCWGGGGFMGMMGYGPWGGFFLGPILMILFWILIIVGIVFLVKSLMHTGGEKTDMKSEMKESKAKEILDMRYAKGEISKEDYERTKNDLSGDSSMSSGGMSKTETAKMNADKEKK